MQIKRIELNLNTLTPFMQQVNHIYSGVCLRKKEEIDKQVGSCFENKIHNVIFLLLKWWFYYLEVINIFSYKWVHN